MTPRLVTLKSGASMPMIGLGTWKMSETETERACLDAFEIGYRHIDTAKLYGNEAGVGRAVRSCGISREEIFVTTKLWPTDFLDPEDGFERSMERLALEYIDLYLVHWPLPLMPKSVWRAMEKISATGRARAIGVSNYGISELEKTLAYARVVPAIDQVECSPWVYDPDLLRFCTQHGIVLEAYSPLTRGARLEHPTLVDIAKRYEKTPAQILLRWNIEHGMVTIPKTTHKARMRENISIFDFSLAPEDTALLDGIRD